ncbi:hypothetical protein [Tissierella praeacuta]|uniref:hypothetical protein n=1 Tax=Tissierella praeacuta TaxID=43131 RepID=UPI0028B175FF|nr:hypothetical protein [Tissierella praeacuta]
MAYNTKPIKRDKDNNPIAQYYDPSRDNYIPLEGSDGANHIKLLNSDNSPVDINLNSILDKLSELTGTVIDEQTRQANEIIRQQLYDEIKQKLENGELQGEVGPQGKGVNILGKYDTLDELVAAHPDGSELDGGFLVDRHYYYWDGTKWEDAGLIQGPKGEPGQVHSVNDKVGDVYLTGEDIRVSQNQPWPISHALNKLNENKLDKFGGKMTGNLDMDYNEISKGVLGAPYKKTVASTSNSPTWNLTLNVPCRAIKLTRDINVVLRGEPGGTNSMSEVIVLIEQPDTAHNVTFTTGIWRDGDSADLLKVPNKIHQVRILKVNAHPFNQSLLEYVGSYPV